MLYLYDGIVLARGRIQSNSIYKYIGDKINLTDYVPYMQMPVIQADGDELQYILRHFVGIPTAGSVKDAMWSRNNIMIWTGDYARFICYNWRN